VLFFTLYNSPIIFRAKHFLHPGGVNALISASPPLMETDKWTGARRVHEKESEVVVIKDGARTPSSRARESGSFSPASAPISFSLNSLSLDAQIIVDDLRRRSGQWEDQ
jgi:hypothetical protein